MKNKTEKRKARNNVCRKKFFIDCIKKNENRDGHMRGREDIISYLRAVIGVELDRKKTEMR